MSGETPRIRAPSTRTAVGGHGAAEPIGGIVEGDGGGGVGRTREGFSSKIVLSLWWIIMGGIQYFPVPERRSITLYCGWNSEQSR